ncbi:uncharacterized protein LOC133878802 isoform X2 [Alnus glutinosa]|uniref:uncharacterized protein LOC133878802 isoform X1 n=1 Tax=Alnus glutinosa TaxID=3517 RepID=UPI002D76CC8A|nr:uncharacterized protein LOC133878802 isoform X1 [Alnus glutinosa]XP_062173325.1 uncharacterized protein LOC133878802 isoform X2 [Alnus glutinosa]
MRACRRYRQSPEVSKSVPLKRFKFSPITITMSYREKSRAQRTPREYRLPTAQGLGSSDLEHTKEGQTPVRPGAYGHTSLTQLGYEYQPASYDTDASFHLSHMPSTMKEVGVCSPSHVARLFPHSSSGADDSETQPLDNSQTQAPDDLHGGAGDTHDVQPEDPATQVLRPDQIRTISINLDGSTCFEVLTIADLHNNWGIPSGKRVVLEYNAASQPVGLSANKFRRQTGKLIRSGAYVHIRDAWAHVKNSMKEDVWNALMVDFYIPPTYDLAAVKRDAFRDMGEKLKSWRYKLKKQLNIQSDDTPEMVRARVGEANLSKYDPEDLEALLDKWCDRANQEYAAHMKALRALNNTPHCAGSKSFARLTHEETITNGTPPTRAQTYIKSHKKKDGSYPNDVIKERCERMTELIPTDLAALSSVTQGTVRWAPNDAYAQAHDNKPEYAGRVRQVGPNVLPVRGTIHSYYIPSQARSQSSRHSTISQEVLDRALKAERARHKAEMDAVLASQAQMVTRYEARFCQLEEMMRQSISVPEVTQHTTTPNRAFIPCLNVRSSVGSGSG